MDEVKALYETILNEYERKVKPRPNRILIRVLGKEVKIGSIIIPDASDQYKQNKPVFEGIVLETYAPYEKHFKTKPVVFKARSLGMTTDFATHQPEQETIVQIEPGVKVGDHVLFRHWAGAKVTLGDVFSEIRFIDEGEIEAVLEYKRKPGTETSMTTSGARNNEDYKNR